MGHMLLQRKQLPAFLLFLCNFLPAFPFNDQHEFPSWVFFGVVRNSPGNRCGKGGFVLFGKLPAEGKPAVPKGFQQFFQRFFQVMRGFVQDDGPSFLPQGRKYCSTLLFFPGQEPFEGKPPCGKAGHSKRRDACRRPWEGGYGNARFLADAHKFFSRVGNAGCAGICN